MRSTSEGDRQFEAPGVCRGRPGAFVFWERQAPILGHKGAELLFSVYARYIPNRTRGDGTALLTRMTGDQQQRGNAIV